MFRHSFKAKGYYRFWIVQYLLILLIPLSLGILMHAASTKTIRDMMLTASKTSLEQSSLNIDSKFEELSNLAKRIALNTEVRSFSETMNPFSAHQHYTVVSLQRNLATYTSYDPFWSSFFIIFARNKSVVGSDIAYNLVSPYDAFININGADIRNSYASLIENAHMGEVLPAQSHMARSDGIRYNIVLYKFGDYFEPQGIICMLVNQVKLQNMLVTALGGNDGMVVMVDENNRILTSVSNGNIDSQLLNDIDLDALTDDQVLDLSSQSLFVSRHASKMNGYQYISFRDLGDVLGTMDKIRNILAGLLIVSIVSSLVLMMYFAWKNGRSVSKLVTSVIEGDPDPSQQSGDPFDWLFVSVSSMANNNQRLATALEHTQPYLSIMLAERLLKNELNSQQEFDDLCRWAEISFKGKFYGTAIIKLCSHAEGSVEYAQNTYVRRRQLVRDILNSYNKRCDILFCNIDESTIAILCAVNGFEEDYMQQISAMGSLLCEAIPEIRIGIGNAFGSALDISRSYVQASKALYQRNIPETPLCYFQNSELSFHPYYYPPDIEIKVINCAISGNTDTLTALLDDLERDNLSNNLSDETQKLFTVEALGTYVKLLDRSGIGGEMSVDNIQILQKAVFDEPPAQAWQKVKQEVIEICNNIHSRKATQHDDLIDSICQYIQKHYSDNSMGLVQVAALFNISDVYLSQLFKDHMGVNFSVYLENIRMSRAQLLLTDTQLSISRIAQAVGYSAFNTFCRAFRRYHGVNATNYRESAASRQAADHPGGESAAVSGHIRSVQQ